MLLFGTPTSLFPSYRRLPNSFQSQAFHRLHTTFLTSPSTPVVTICSTRPFLRPKPPLTTITRITFPSRFQPSTATKRLARIAETTSNTDPQVGYSLGLAAHPIHFSIAMHRENAGDKRATFLDEEKGDDDEDNGGGLEGEKSEILRFRCIWPTAVGGIAVSGGSAGGALNAVRAVFNAVDPGRLWDEREDERPGFASQPNRIALVVAGSVRERKREYVQGLIGDCITWAKGCLKKREADWVSVLLEEGGKAKRVVVVVGAKEREDTGLFFDTGVGERWLDEAGWSVSPVLKQVWASEEEWPGSRVGKFGEARGLLGENDSDGDRDVRDELEYSGDRTRVLCGGWPLDRFAERLWRYVGKKSEDVSLEGIEDDGLTEEEREKAGLSLDIPPLTVMVVSGWNESRAHPMIEELDKYLQAKLIDLKFGRNVLHSPPTSRSVQENLEFADELKPDLILSFGGGSALDVAKVVAALYPASREIRNYVLSGEHAMKTDPVALECPPLPLVLIPNTLSAQVELSSVSVLSTAKGLLPLIFSWRKVAGPRDQPLRTALIDARLISPRRKESIYAAQGALLTFCASMDRYHPRAVRWPGLTVKEQLALLRREPEYGEGVPRIRVLTDAVHLATVAEAENRFLGRIVVIGLGMIDIWNRGSSGDGEGKGRRQGHDIVWLREIVALVAAGVLTVWGEEAYGEVARAGNFNNVKGMIKWLMDAWEDHGGRKVIVDAEDVIRAIAPLRVLERDDRWQEKVTQVVQFVKDAETVPSYGLLRWKEYKEKEAKYRGTVRLDRTRVPKEVKLPAPIRAW